MWETNENGDICMRKVKHNKIRNTGLLYEFLLRQITLDVLKNENTSKAVQIIKKRFNENTELGKELALYNILTTKKFKSDKKAEYFISEVVSTRHKLNNSILKRERYNLIKELKENYDLQKFMSSKVKNYKAHASAYKLFEYSAISPEQKTESFFNLVEHVTTNNDNIKLSETVGTKLPADEDLRILTYKTLLERFNQKYTKLNLSQKNLLRAYINNISGTSSLKEYLETEIPKVKKGLVTYSKNLKDDVVKIKLKEAINSINEFCKLTESKNVKDSSVVQMMRYYELLKELKKSGSKNKKTL
tara:strand:+ start:1002 stop:1910 length:909 start_codon:yes stop_codon:yes gene_type:complete